MSESPMARIEREWMAQWIAEGVLVFAIPGDARCRLATERLGACGVPYREVDITSDGQGLRIMLALTGRSDVPVVSSYGELMVGLDFERLDELIVLATERARAG